MNYYNDGAAEASSDLIGSRIRGLLLCTPRPLPEHPAPGVTHTNQTNLGVCFLLVTLKRKHPSRNEC